jgi:hypothetical protein
MWNFLSCDAAALAGWSFRIYFGGPNYNSSESASQDEVFHMLDVIYGISDEFDYLKNLKMNDNSTSRDVMQNKKLIQKIAGKDGTVEKSDFIRLVQKTPMLLMRIISAHTDMRKDCVGTGFWNSMAQQRRPSMSIDEIAKKIESLAPCLLWANGMRSASKSGGVSSKKTQSKYAVDAGAGRTTQKKTKLDEEEDRAAQRMQSMLRSKKARKEVRKARAVKSGASAAKVETPWSEVWDPHYKAYYYYNNKTEACVWEKPEGFVSPSGN